MEQDGLEGSNMVKGLARHELSPDRVDIWLTAMNDPATDIDRLFKLLNPDERKRADRLRIEKKKRQFIIGRAFLRTTIATYLNQSPSQICFSYGKDGKPSVAGDLLSFNASHSGDWYLLAVTKGRTIGIDIERERNNLDFIRVAERFFSAEERQELASIDSKDQQRAFFRGWTRKEAYLKALGSGLRFPLDQFAVSLCDNPALLSNYQQAGEPERWNMLEIDVPDGYMGAVVFDGGPAIIKTKS